MRVRTQGTVDSGVGLPRPIGRSPHWSLNRLGAVELWGEKGQAQGLPLPERSGIGGGAWAGTGPAPTGAFGDRRGAWAGTRPAPTGAFKDWRGAWAGTRPAPTGAFGDRRGAWAGTGPAPTGNSIGGLGGRGLAKLFRLETCHQCGLATLFRLETCHQCRRRGMLLKGGVAGGLPPHKGGPKARPPNCSGQWLVVRDGAASFIRVDRGLGMV